MPRRRKPENNHPSHQALEIYELFQKGEMSGPEIAKKFGLNRTYIHNIKYRVERWYLPQFAGEVREIRLKQTQLLLKQYDEAELAWERSKQSAVKVSMKRTGSTGPFEKTETTEEQCGDPRYLDIMLKCLADIRKIWGADAPEKIANTDSQGNDVSDAARTQYDELLAAIRGVVPSGGGGVTKAIAQSPASAEERPAEVPGPALD